jgi:hypothetical protein
MVQLASTGVKPFTGLAQLSVAGLPAGVGSEFLEPGACRRPDREPVAGLAGDARRRYLQRAHRWSRDNRRCGPDAERDLQAQGDRSCRGAGVVGRFVDLLGRGIAGIIVRAEDAMAVAASNLALTTSDAGGNFLLTGLPAGRITLRIDATPANPGFRSGPTHSLLEAGKITPLSDWVVQPPPRDDLFKPLIANHSDDQLFSNPDTPGLSVRVPAGVTIQGWDGVVKSRMAIERVAPDKLPTEAVPAAPEATTASPSARRWAACH